MSERGFTGVFVGALLVGVVATLAVYRLVIERTGTGDAGELNTIPVVVAAADIPEGMLVSGPRLRVKQFAPGAVPQQGTFASTDSLEGRVSRLPIFAGEPVLENKLAPRGAGAGLEVKIQPGRRAMAIPVNEHVGISGMILPNSRVDVLVTLRPEATRQERTAKVFLQNMRVLSVGQELRRGEDGKPITANTVTLEVTPHEAELLAVAMNEGVLQLALRGYADSDSVGTRGAAARNILAARKAQTTRRPRPARRIASKPAPAPPPQEPAWLKVEIFRGSEKTDTTVELTETDEATAVEPGKRGDGNAEKNY